MKKISILFLFFLVLYGCDPCKTVECNQGTCVDGDCNCNAGWTGDNCDVDMCASLACVHGTCTAGACVCEANYQGTLCDDIIDPCLDVDCSNHGDCVAATGECDCDDGWSGDDCSEAASICTNACGEGGVWNNDGSCDDGGPGSEYFACDCGTDCGDCGTRSTSDCSSEVDGSLVVWTAMTTFPCNTQVINIWVDRDPYTEAPNGTLTSYLSSEPSCDDAGTFTIGLSEGTHNLYCECDDGDAYWDGGVYIEDGYCTIIGLTPKKNFVEKRKAHTK